MSTKPKTAAQKRNHETIRLLIRSPVLRALKARQDAGGCLSLLDDLQLAELTDLVSSAVMHNESITINVKRSR